MKKHRLLLSVAGLLFLTSALLAWQLGWPRNRAQAAAGTSYLTEWQEGSNFVIDEFWNAPVNAGCDYANNPWPQAELAAQRAYVLGARQVLRDEWDINSWIKANRASSSQARIHGAETSCPNGHADYPPHVHIFYLSIDNSGGWHHINSHHYPGSDGKIYANHLIRNLCGLNTSYDPPAGEWVGILDETCGAAWQQRFTTAGDIELRRSSTADVYQLRSTSINGDLAGLDVLLNGSVIYSIAITQYDPVGMRWVAQISDYRKNLLTTETWWGDPTKGINLAGHTVQTAPLNGTPTPTDTPVPSPTPTNTPVPSPSPIPDTAPPTVSITGPANGATVVRGSTVTIAATAADNVGVVRVAFYVNNSLGCTDVTVPYQCNWKVPNKRGAAYTLQAKAYDAAGNVGTASVQVRGN